MQSAENYNARAPDRGLKMKIAARILGGAHRKRGYRGVPHTLLSRASFTSLPPFINLLPMSPV